MQSKTSFFNKTIFKRNISQFGIIAIAMFAIYFFAFTFNVFLEITKNPTELTNMYDTTLPQAKIYAVESIIEAVCEPFVVFFVAIIVAVGLFGYMFTARQANMMHAFPVKLSELYFTNVISGLLIIIGPIALNALILFCLSCTMSMELAMHVLLFLLYISVYTLFFFGLACFTVMFTGQMVFGFSFYFILNFLYIGIRVIFSALVTSFGYGLTSSDMEANNPLFFMYYLSNNVEMTHERELINGEYTGPLKYYFVGEGTLALYAVAGVVLLILGYVAYRKRKVESASDFITFNWAKVLFRWGFASCMGVLISMFLTEIYTGYTVSQKKAAFYVTAFILIVVFFFIGQMLIKKGFRVNERKTVIESLVCAAVFSILLIGADMVGYGLEYKIPDSSEVEYVSINGNWRVKLTGEDVEKIIDVQRMLLDNRDEIEKLDYGQANQWLYISYKLKNGKVITRAYDYYVDPSSDVAGNDIYKKFSDAVNSKESVRKTLFMDKVEHLTLRDANVNIYTESDEYRESKPISKGSYDRLMAAIIADVEAGNVCIASPFENYKKGGHILPTIAIGLDSDIILDNSFNGYKEETTFVWEDINITPNCENIVKFLMEEDIISDSSELEPYFYNAM